jgi:ZIP family zinc transporter
LSGYVLVSVFTGVLPFLLAAAGGAMLYVISDEIIPESHAHGFEKGATFALIIGFLVVLILQSVLG